MSKIGQTMKLSVELINHGDVVMVYSPEMQCEFPVRPQDVDETLKCLVCEWTRILRADEKLQDEGTPPYTLLIGGETVEKAHSWKHFDTELMISDSCAE